MATVLSVPSGHPRGRTRNHSASWSSVPGGCCVPADLAELELVNARVSAEGAQSAPAAPVFAGATNGEARPSSTRQVYFELAGWTETVVYQRDTLPVGSKITGPAVIEQLDSTTLVIPGSSIEVDPRRNLICRVG